jgi:hypothetical protein
MLFYVLGGWIALNAAVATAVLTRRARPHLRHRLFRWVIGDRTVPPHQWAHDLMVAHRRHH